jgi:Zn-dependent peptidase ImmA (M78 family)
MRTRTNPNVLPRTRREDDFDAAVGQLLEEYRLNRIPVPVDLLAKRLGAQLRYSPLDGELSGMIYVKDGVPIIGVNSLHHPNRQRFTIAHELAHLCLHKDALTKAVHVDKGFGESALHRDSVSATGTDQSEIQANRFAAALLVPRPALEAAVGDKLIDIEDETVIGALAKKFKVSTATLQYRLRYLATA